MTNGNNNGHNRNGSSNGLIHLNGVNGNGAHGDPAIITEHELLWDGLSPAVMNALSQPIDPALVSQRKGRGGRVFDYLEGHTVIDQANRIFGHGAWGYELAGDVTLRRIESVDARTGEVTVSHVYSTPVRVTVAGALPRTDIGVHAVAEDTPDGHDTAIKGCVTDGMKRAFRSFGCQFGNSLYGDQSPAGGASKPERVPVHTSAKGNNQPRSSNGNAASTETLRKRLLELAAEQGFDESGVRTAVQRQTGKGLDDLTADEIGPLVEAAANKLRERQAQAA